MAVSPKARDRDPLQRRPPVGRVPLLTAVDERRAKAAGREQMRGGEARGRLGLPFGCKTCEQGREQSGTGATAKAVLFEVEVGEKTVGIVLGFLRNEGPSDKVQALIDQIPGAEAAIAASSSNGGLSRLMGGGLMALGTKLMALGLGMSEIQNVARELFRFGRDKIGADQMGEIISGTPGLSQFA